MSIRTRLFLLLAVLALVPLAVLGFFSYATAVSAVRDRVEDQLGKLRGDLVEATGAEVKRLEERALQIGREDNVSLYLTYHGRKDVGFLVEIIGSVLEHEARRDTGIAGFAVVFLGDTTIAWSRAAVPVPPADRLPEKAGVHALEGGLLDVVAAANRGGNEALVHVIVPVEILLGPVRAASIGGSVPAAGFLLCDGRLHTDHPGENEPMPELHRAAVTGVLRYGGRVAAAGAVPGTPLVVGASLPEEEFLAPLQNVRTLALAIGAAVLVVVAGASLAFATRITRPVKAMAAAAHRLADGDLAARLEVRSRDELGQLSADFNAMAERLKQTIGNLDRRLKDMTALYEASAIINVSADLEEVAALASEVLANGFGAEAAVFLRTDGAELRPVHSHGPVRIEASIPRDAGFVKAVFETREAQIFADPADDERLSGRLPSAFLENRAWLVAVPLVAARREAGLLLFAGAGTAPDEEELKLLSVLGSLLSPPFFAADRAGTRMLCEEPVKALAELMARMDRLDSHCALVAVEAKDAAEGARIAALVAAKAPHAYRVSPACVLAFLPGASAVEAEAEVSAAIGDHAAVRSVRALGYPDEEGSAEDLVARILARP